MRAYGVRRIDRSMVRTACERGRAQRRAHAHRARQLARGDAVRMAASRFALDTVPAPWEVHEESWEWLFSPTWPDM